MALLHLLGWIDFPTYNRFCTDNHSTPENCVFIFPGNTTHHGNKHNLYSQKRGGGLAAFAMQLGGKELPVLSLPTTGMGSYSKNEKIKNTANDAIADLWKAVGAGYDLVLPVRKFNSLVDRFFSSPLDSTDYEPNFWGQNDKTPNLSLANFYIEHLDRLAKFMKVKDTDKEASYLSKLEKEHPNLFNAYQSGKNIKKDDPWLQTPSGKFKAPPHKTKDMSPPSVSNIPKSVLTSDDNHIRKQAILALSELFNEDDYTEEGIFRKSPLENEKKEAVSQILNNDFSVLKSIKDPHLKAGVLKQLIRDLRDKDKQPIFNDELRDALIKAMAQVNEETKLTEVKALLSTLAPEDKLVLTSILKLCANTIKEHDTSKMDSSNLATVLAPNFFNYPKDLSKILEFNAKFNTIFQLLVDKESELTDALSIEPSPVENEAPSPKNSKNMLFPNLKKAIEEKEWEVGLWGGVTVSINDKIKKVMPFHVAELYKVCKNSAPETFQQDIERTNDIINQRNIPNGVIAWIKAQLKKLDFFNLFSRKNSTEDFYVKTQQGLFKYRQEPELSEENTPPKHTPSK